MPASKTPPHAALLLLAFSLACSPKPPPAGADAPQGSGAASHTVTPGHPGQASALPLVASADAKSCLVRHSCGLSHPGLGTHTRTLSVSLATCTRLSSASSAPFPGDEPPLEPSPAAPSDSALATKRTADKQHGPEPIPAADCARIQSLVASITAADAKNAEEAAPHDTEACTLTVLCGQGQPPDTRIQVQRQSLTGTGPVERMLRALHGQP